MQDEEQSYITYQNQWLKKILESADLSDGEHVIIRNVSRFKYPIKIIVAVENDIVTVITNYPLKKGTE